MPRGIYDRRKEAEEQIENEMNASVVGGHIQEAATEAMKPNEFTDDYTLNVIADHDPSADIFRIPNKNPAYEYRFLRDDFENVSVKSNQLLFQGGGWQLCPKQHLLKIGIEERLISPDGFYRIGKHILAFMPKELYLKKMSAKEKKANAPISDIKRLLKDGNPGVGGKDIHDTMKGIRPGHMDGGRVVFDK